MTMTKHTPGPWVIDDLGDESLVATNHKYGIGSFQGIVYRLAKIEGIGKESLANARLIAAAPDLLEALKAFVDPWSKGGDWQSQINYATFDKARKAIAKVCAEK